MLVYEWAFLLGKAFTTDSRLVQDLELGLGIKFFMGFYGWNLMKSESSL